jgi:dethiobiotin synthetase
MSRGKILFITGTDTGAGKTVLTALLLAHLRSQGVEALAMKPICTGSRSDVRFLQSFQSGELSDEVMNPFWFKTPAAPIVAAKNCREKPTQARLKRSVQGLQKKCDILLVEGAGGLMVPLAHKLTWEGIIKSLKCSVLVAAKNELGVINHSLLTMGRLQLIGVKRLGLCLVNQVSDGKKSSCPAVQNARVLREFTEECSIFEIPFLGGKRMSSGRIEASQNKLKKSLAQILKIV